MGKPAPLEGTQPLNVRTAHLLGWLAARTLARKPAFWVSQMLMPLAFGLVATVWGAGLVTAVGVAVVAGLVWLPLIGVLTVGIVAGWCSRGWVVGYFDGSSTQLVHLEGGDWVLSDHYTLRRGAGAARPFRRRVFAHLAAEADRCQATIRMDTRHRRLAELYLADMPGLVMSEECAARAPVFRLTRPGTP